MRGKRTGFLLHSVPMLTIGRNLMGWIGYDMSYALIHRAQVIINVHQSQEGQGEIYPPFYFFKLL